MAAPIVFGLVAGEVVFRLAGYGGWIATAASVALVLRTRASRNLEGFADPVDAGSVRVADG